MLSASGSARGGDLLDLALILRHDGRAARGEHDVGAVVRCHDIGDRVHQRPLFAHAADRCQDRVGQCSAPLIWLSTCVRPSAASTSTEIAAPTAVDSRKLGTKVKSAAEALFISSAATG